MKIYIPSYKRAGRVKTRITLGGAGIIACHEFEEDEYREKEGGKISVIPDSLRGNISKVRNWILDHCVDRELVMMDDDISEIGYHQDMKLHEMSPDEIMFFLNKGYVIARELSLTLWGINLQYAPKFYREFSPLSFLSPVCGTFSCHLNPKLKYDESLFLNEDYDFFLKTIQTERKVMRWNRYYYIAGHLDEVGGCGSYRLKETEIEQSKKMVERWGNKVLRYDLKKTLNPRVRVPIRGI